MGSKYPVLPPETIIKVLEKLGSEKSSQKRSHAKFVKRSSPAKVVIVPMH